MYVCMHIYVCSFRLLQVFITFEGARLFKICFQFDTLLLNPCLSFKGKTLQEKSPERLVLKMFGSYSVLVNLEIM